MTRSLLLSAKSMLLVLSLVFFGTSPLFAQPPYIGIADEQVQLPAPPPPFIQFLGFNNNCSTIDFRLVVGGISQFYNRVIWTADNQPSQNLPAGATFSLTAPSVSITAQRAIQFGNISGLVGSPITLNTPPLSSFTVVADPTTVKMCPHELGETTVTSNRCVGTTSWGSVITPFGSTAPTDGIAVILTNESAGFGFDPTSTVDVVIGPDNYNALSQGTFTYLVQVTGTETLSGNSETENILVISFEDCADIPPGFQASDELVADFARAADRRRGPSRGQDLDSRSLLDRLYDEISRARGGDRAKNLSSAESNTPPVTAATAVNADFAVFPNPAQDFITVSYENTPVQLRILDITGRVVREMKNAAVGLDQTTIQVSELKTGVYLLEAITAEGEREVRKVQVNR